MNKKVFIVRGSEDGNLGVYSNVKRAWARCERYLTQNGEQVEGSYAAARRAIADHGWYDAHVKGNQRVTCEIGRFFLNE
jgi:hypothetical protein